MSGYASQEGLQAFVNHPADMSGELSLDDIAILLKEANASPDGCSARFLTNRALVDPWVIRYPTTDGTIEDIDTAVNTALIYFASSMPIRHSIGLLVARSLGSPIPSEPCRLRTSAELAQATVNIGRFFAHLRELGTVSPYLLDPAVQRSIVSYHNPGYSDGQLAFDNMTFEGDGR